MTSSRPIPLQIKIVLGIVWTETIVAILLGFLVIGSVGKTGGRTLVEAIFAVLFTFVCYANYRLAKGALWAYRYALWSSGVVLLRFFVRLATERTISGISIVGVVLDVVVIALLLAAPSRAFYERKRGAA